jgi:hypothetical protein
MIMRAMVPPEVSCGEPGARAVRRPTERSGHVVTRNLAARIDEYEVTTSSRVFRKFVISDGRLFGPGILG